MTMWDAFQREMLHAMGHTVLVPVSARGGAPAMPAESTAPRAPAAPVAEPGAQPALLRALALAAGIDDLVHRIGLPPLAELRTPAAKRRLWPRLRALRKTPPA